MFFLLLARALAGDDACQACCRAGGLAGCNSDVKVYGEGSKVSREGASYRVVGTWEVACDGIASFNYGGTVVLDHEPEYGELIMQLVNPLQVHCVRQGCDLPVGTCISAADDKGRFALVGCEDGLPADARSMQTAPRAPKYTAATIVVLDGRPLVVQPSAATPVPVASNTVTTIASTTYTPSTPNTATITTTTSNSTSTSSAAVTPSAPFPNAVPIVARPTEDALTQLAASLPNDPPETCRPPGDAIRAEARRRVDMGDEHRVTKNATGAIQEYRAALSMDVCNAYGWLGIGQTTSELARPDLAIRALKNATKLLPAHYGAWALLGRNYENIGQTRLAAEAYEKALALKPTMPEALDGWRRTAAPR